MPKWHSYGIQSSSSYHLFTYKLTVSSCGCVWSVLNFYETDAFKERPITMPKNALTHKDSTRMKDKRIPNNPIKIHLGCFSIILGNQALRDLWPWSKTKRTSHYERVSGLIFIAHLCGHTICIWKLKNKEVLTKRLNYIFSILKNTYMYSQWMEYIEHTKFILTVYESQ